MQVLVTLLWLRGNRSSELRFWLESLDGLTWLETLDGHTWLQTGGGKDWLQTQMSQSWLQIQRGQNSVSLIQPILPRIRSSVLQESPQTPPDRIKLQARSAHHPVQILPRIKPRAESARNPAQTQPKQILLPTRVRNDWLQTQRGKDWVQSHVGKDWVWTQGGQDWLQTQGGTDWLQTDGGKFWVQTHGTPDWLQTEGGQQWLQTLAGQDWLQTLGGQYWLKNESGQDWLLSREGKDWLQTPSARDWLQTPSARKWLQAPDGRDWLQTPQGQMWRWTTAWVAMEEFSNTLEAIKQHIIIPELSSQPAFRVIQQFKSLPDFLMFPVFLALRHQNYSTFALKQGRLPPDMKIISAMKVFTDFANKAHERSQPSSDVLNYACQNWAVHISRAPKPWDENLAHIFMSFWDRHLLNWLERQWCVKGLQSCLTVLSEVDKLAKEHLQTAGHLNNQSEAFGFSEGEKTANDRLLQTQGHLSDQSEAVGFSEGKKPANRKSVAEEKSQLQKRELEAEDECVTHVNEVVSISILLRARAMLIEVAARCLQVVTQAYTPDERKGYSTGGKKRL
ncbi:hypothetical protein BD769DRAFT_1638803 [Suillus cothurnatus]|nr:hypothetical protein BD769DRAFT_1638803 [Suillus cothurnatus]